MELHYLTRQVGRVLSEGNTRYTAVAGKVQSKHPKPMQISLMIWTGPGSDSAVINVGSACEAATYHQIPPQAFRAASENIERQGTQLKGSCVSFS
jgi:hypothetical protein